MRLAWDFPKLFTTGNAARGKKVPWAGAKAKFFFGVGWMSGLKS
jgi:hypothetical protein